MSDRLHQQRKRAQTMSTINIPESPFFSLENYEISYDVIENGSDDVFRGDTIDEAVEKLARAYGNVAYGNVRSADVKIIVWCQTKPEAISAYVAELQAVRRAKETAAKLRQSQEFYDILLGAWQKEVDALNADAVDYTPEGFNKRWQALQAKKPVKPCL